MGWSNESRNASDMARKQKQAKHDEWVGPRLLELLSEGYKWIEAAEQLNAEGFCAPRNGPLGKVQVFRIAQRMVAQRMELQKIEIKRMENQRGTTQRFIPSLENELAAGREAAERGDAQAQYDVGLIYAGGLGVSQNLAEGATWFQKAAEQGHALAQVNLGHLYVYGRGVTQNDAEAVKWFRKAAEQGLAPGQFCLGTMYCDGRGVPQDDAEAAKWLRKAAEQDHFLPRYEEQKDIALTPINLSVLEARCNLGYMYLDGRGVPQDDAEAVRWWRKAAEPGDAEAVRWWRKAAEPGDAEAVRWWRKAAEPGDAEAVRWWRKAAEPGDAEAQYRLGFMYRNGRGVPQKDHAEARKWFYKAAQQGHAQAQHELGVMYDDDQDDVQAYAWFSLAAAQDHTGSAEKRDCIAKRLRLTSEKLARARKVAGKYWKAYVQPFRRGAHQ